MSPSDVQAYIETAMSLAYDYEAVPGSVKVFPDPQVAGTYAARFTDPRQGTIDLLFITGQEEGNVAAVLDRTLEEVEYESWPPRSGGLQFF